MSCCSNCDPQLRVDLVNLRSKLKANFSFKNMKRLICIKLGFKVHECAIFSWGFMKCVVCTSILPLSQSRSVSLAHVSHLDELSFGQGTSLCTSFTGIEGADKNVGCSLNLTLYLKGKIYRNGTKAMSRIILAFLTFSHFLWPSSSGWGVCICRDPDLCLFIPFFSFLLCSGCFCATVSGQWHAAFN